jgi:hypothetical protein
MNRGEARALWAACTAALLVAAPATGRAVEAVAVAERPRAGWQVEAGAAYVAADSFGGWGVSLRAGRVHDRFLMVGFGIESGRLHAEGTVPVAGGAFSQTFQSTLAAAFFRVQAPTPFVTPYAELALGFAAIHGKDGFNYQCNYGSSAGGAAALGVDGHVVPSLSVGLRGGLRLPSMSFSCTAGFGPYTFDLAVMKSLGMTVTYRW